MMLVQSPFLRQSWFRRLKKGQTNHHRFNIFRIAYSGYEPSNSAGDFSTTPEMNAPKPVTHDVTPVEHDTITGLDLQ
jgi:hypothetical protein